MLYRTVLYILHWNVIWLVKRMRWFKVKKKLNTFYRTYYPCTIIVSLMFYVCSVSSRTLRMICYCDVWTHRSVGPEVWSLTQTQHVGTGARDRGEMLRLSSCRGGRATDRRYHSPHPLTHNHPPGALCLLLIQDRLHFSPPNLWNFFQRAVSAVRWRAFWSQWASNVVWSFAECTVRFDTIWFEHHW